MSRAQAQLFRLYEEIGPTRERWQSYWATTITYETHKWDYLPFDASGFVEGDSGSDQSITVTMPATRRVVVASERALAGGWLAELRIFQFDSSIANGGPPAGMTLIGQFNGQVVGGRAKATEFTLQLGSALSPVGATVPPRRLTTAIMGQGAQL
jgi:hypothetical protein